MKKKSQTRVRPEIDKSNRSLYSKNLMEMKVTLLPLEIGENQTSNNLKSIIKHSIEGKCIHEGYVKPNSVNIRTYSSGLIKGERIEFTVLFECYTCNPVEGTILFGCLVKSVTKAGIHCEVMDENGNVPISVFVARDHFVENIAFQKIKEEDKIDICVIGNRFELNDECVEVIGYLV